MSHKKKQSVTEVSNNKKAAVLGIEKKKKKIVPYAVFSICAALVIAAVVFFQGNVQSSPNRSVTQNVGEGKKDLSQVQVVTYPTTLFDEGKAKHFEFPAQDGITIKYFVLKSSDGVIRAAFDACDVCWPSGKGYYQEQDKMVCRNCGKRFASVKINEVKGGCNPAPLNRKIDGENLVIKVKDILDGRRYFDFRRRG